ncbi:hypothetical protein Tco_1121912 [Tanacetum coccineum]|uniref:Uncharacterized protein n=1 Tax=Tanacetum coccineum TaxID=301880 RepID=A0ABQ5IZ46_9ASTR
MNHQISSVPQISYQTPQVPTQPMTELPLADSGLAVPVFSLGDDHIACLNKAMAFLTAVASLRFSSTNNQLRTSSNPRNQATIQDGRVTVQQVQGRQGKRYYGEGHMARQCTQPKRPRNVAWYKDKAMLAEAQEAGQILDEEKLAFLADPGIPDGQDVQTIIPNNAAFQTEDLDTYDSDCDDISNAKAVLMANISNYDSDVISEVPYSDTYLNDDIENQSVHAMQDIEQTPVVDFTDNEIHSDRNTIPYSQYLQETQQVAVQETNLQVQQDSMILSVIEQIQSAQTMDMLTKPQAFYDNIHKQALGYQNPFYLKKAQRIKPTLYDGVVISDKHVAMPVINDEETLILEQVSRSKMSEKEKDPEAIKQNISQKPIDYEILNRLSEDFRKRFTPQQELSAEQAFWFRISNPTIESSDKPPVKVKVPCELPKKVNGGFEHTKSIFNNESIPFLKSLKDIFNVFDKDLLNEIMEVQTIFDQMEAVVQQSTVDKQCLEIAKKELLLENDRLLQKIMSQDFILNVMKSLSLNAKSVNVEMQRSKSCDKCFNLDAEFSKSKQAYNDLLKNYS